MLPTASKLKNRSSLLCGFLVASALSFQVCASEIAVVGPIDKIDCGSQSIKILGVVFAADHAATSALCSGGKFQVSSYVSAVGVTDQNGFVRLRTLTAISDSQYVPGASFVYLRGEVSSSNRSTGKISLSGAIVDLQASLANPGELVEILGTQPQPNGVILTVALNASLAQTKTSSVGSGSELISSVGSGASLMSSVGSGAAKNSSVGSGKELISSVGSGASLMSSVGSGAAKNSSVGSGKELISSVGSGASLMSSVGSGAAKNSSVGSGKELISSVGSGASLMSSVGSGAAKNSSVGSGKELISSVGSGASLMSSVGSGSSLMSSVGSGTAKNSSVGSGRQLISSVGSGASLMSSVGSGTD